MKPFITPDISATGQKVLRLQCEGVAPEDIWKSVQGLSVVGYALPPGQSIQAAWIFQLIFDDGSLIDFSSACTQVAGWQEVGSLNMQLIRKLPKEQLDKGSDLLRTDVLNFRLNSLAKLAYADDDVSSECALVFCGENGEEIIVATGIPPGSVSISAPFLETSFEPEFSVSECKRELLSPPRP